MSFIVHSSLKDRDKTQLLSLSGDAFRAFSVVLLMWLSRLRAWLFYTSHFEAGFEVAWLLGRLFCIVNAAILGPAVLKSVLLQSGALRWLWSFLCSTESGSHLPHTHCQRQTGTEHGNRKLAFLHGQQNQKISSKEMFVFVGTCI